MIRQKYLSQTQAVTRLDAKTEGKKGTAKKTCFKYPKLLSWAVVQDIPFAASLLEASHHVGCYYEIMRRRRNLPSRFKAFGTPVTNAHLRRAEI